MAATSPALSPRAATNNDVDLCVELLDESMIAYLAGVDSVGEFRRWRAGAEPGRPGIAARLATVRRVLLAFDAANALPLVEAWLREAGAAGEMPARLIRDKGDDDETGVIVTEAADQWLRRRPAIGY